MPYDYWGTGYITPWAKVYNSHGGHAGLLRHATSAHGTRKQLTTQRGSLVYLTLPFCPWAKGRTGYTNRPFRQDILKNSQFPPLTWEQTKQMQNKINTMPRMKL